MAFLGTTFMKIEKSKLNYTYSINHITTNQIEYPQRCFRKLFPKRQIRFKLVFLTKKFKERKHFFDFSNCND